MEEKYIREKAERLYKLMLKSREIKKQISGIVISLSGVLLGANITLINTTTTIVLKVIFLLMYLACILSLMCMVLRYLAIKVDVDIKKNIIIDEIVHHAVCGEDICTIDKKKNHLIWCEKAGVILFIVTLVLLFVYVAMLLFTK